MIKTANITRLNMIRMPDTLRPSVIETNKNNDTGVNIHFGSNMDIVIVVAKHKQLNRDNLERIRILTEVRQ